MCILLGNLNINLLSSDIHRPTEDFINNMYTYFMNPQIIQPSRITGHTATLIDNIFFKLIQLVENMIQLVEISYLTYQIIYLIF